MYHVSNQLAMLLQVKNYEIRKYEEVSRYKNLYNYLGKQRCEFQLKFQLKSLSNLDCTNKELLLPSNATLKITRKNFWLPLNVLNYFRETYYFREFLRSLLLKRRALVKKTIIEFHITVIDLSFL